MNNMMAARRLWRSAERCDIFEAALRRAVTESRAETRSS